MLGDHERRPREYDEYGEGTMEVMGDVRRVGCISESGGHFGLEEELHRLLIMCGGILYFCTMGIMVVQNVVDIRINLGSRLMSSRHIEMCSCQALLTL